MQVAALLTIIDSSYFMAALVMVALGGTADMASGAADVSSMKATFFRLRMVVSSSGKSDGVGVTAEFVSNRGVTAILFL